MWGLILSRHIINFHWDYFIVLLIVLMSFLASSFWYLESGSPFGFLKRHIEIPSVSQYGLDVFALLDFSSGSFFPFF
jgi:hypothetical protein